MREPKWIRVEAAEIAHERQIAEFGGRPGIRDRGLLESALHRPKHLFQFAHQKPSIFELAATYAFGIVRNRPFTDGNKRVAAVVCLAFLELSRIEVIADTIEFRDTFFALAAGELSEAQLSEWLAAHSKRMPR